MDITLKKNKEWQQVFYEIACTSATVHKFDVMPREVHF